VESGNQKTGGMSILSDKDCDTRSLHLTGFSLAVSDHAENEES